MSQIKEGLFLKKPAGTYKDALEKEALMSHLQIVESKPLPLVQEDYEALADHGDAMLHNNILLCPLYCPSGEIR